MLNWIYYQLAMFYLWRAHRVKDSIKNFETWNKYMEKSLTWIRKIKGA